MSQAQGVVKIKTHILHSKTFFQKSKFSSVYDNFCMQGSSSY